MYKITSKQMKVLDAIMIYTKDHKYPPSVRELCEILHIQSSSTIHRHLKKLKLHGLVTWEPHCPRTLQVIEEE